MRSYWDADVCLAHGGKVPAWSIFFYDRWAAFSTRCSAIGYLACAVPLAFEVSGSGAEVPSLNL
ncbi:MAG: hypothetical protein AAF827_15305 [Cyanobacteria bacterium P01_D01_bin.6]